MITDNKIMTTAVEKELPQYLRNIIWYMLENMDYQYEQHCFNLNISTGENSQSVQKIVHSFEAPAYCKELSYSSTSPVNARVVVKIDRLFGTQMMMLADEVETYHGNE